jgi:hypothetical protein
LGALAASGFSAGATAFEDSTTAGAGLGGVAPADFAASGCDAGAGAGEGRGCGAGLAPGVACANAPSVPSQPRQTTIVARASSRAQARVWMRGRIRVGFKCGAVAGGLEEGAHTRSHEQGQHEGTVQIAFTQGRNSASAHEPDPNIF